MANPENILNANAKRTPSKRRENAKKAGIASGAARRWNGDWRKLMKEAGNIQLNDIGKNKLKRMGITLDPKDKESATLALGAMMGMFVGAMNGDAKCMAQLRLDDTIGASQSVEDDPITKALKEDADGLFRKTETDS